MNSSYPNDSSIINSSLFKSIKNLDFSIINSDIDHLINDYDVWINELINTTNESFITEAGDVEKWIGSSKKKLLENKEETIKYLQNLKK